MTRLVPTPVLDVAVEEHGPDDGPVVVLLHGFPDDARSWDAVATELAGAGHRVIAPYLRGFGPTRFRDATVPRGGQLSALVADLRSLLDTLALDRVTLVGQDWGARVAQALAAQHPERVASLVSLGGYQITWNPAPSQPPVLHAMWFQWLLMTDLGPAVLAADRQTFCRYLWQVWSPTWDRAASDQEYAATAPSFDNPDFVDVVVSAYRRERAEGVDPAVEQALSAGPRITLPAVVLLGADDPLEHPFGPDARAEPDYEHFMALRDWRVLEGVGHFPHREAPDVVSAAVRTLSPT